MRTTSGFLHPEHVTLPASGSHVPLPSLLTTPASVPNGAETPSAHHYLLYFWGRRGEGEQTKRSQQLRNSSLFAYACSVLRMDSQDTLKILSCAQAETFPSTRSLLGLWSAPPIWTTRARCCAQISSATQGQRARAPDQTLRLSAAPQELGSTTQGAAGLPKASLETYRQQRPSARSAQAELCTKTAHKHRAQQPQQRRDPRKTAMAARHRLPLAVPRQHAPCCRRGCLAPASPRSGARPTESSLRKQRCRTAHPGTPS